MRLDLFWLFLVFLSLVLVTKQEEDVYTGPSEEDVVVLDKENLEATIYESD